MQVEERPSHHIGSRLYVRSYEEGKNEVPGNCGSGQLTRVGYDQHIRNGEALRRLYSSDLPAQYNASVMYTRSTDKPRTYTSVEALLFGLYPTDPSGSGDDCYSNLHIQSMDIETENMTPNPTVCAKLAQIKTDLEASEAYKNYIANVRLPLIKEVTPVFGIPADFVWAGIFDCTQADLCHNMTIPSGVTQSLYDRIAKDHFYTNLMLLNWVDRASGFTYAQIAMGSFVVDILSRIDAVVQGVSKEKLAIFSGHDNTLEPLTMAYGVNNGHSPPYAAIMRIELLDGGSGGDLIRAYYDDTPLTFPGCGGTTCSYKAFKSLSEQLIQASKLCSTPQQESQYKRTLDFRL